MEKIPCHLVIVSLCPGFRRGAVAELRQVVYGLLLKIGIFAKLAQPGGQSFQLGLSLILFLLQSFRTMN